VICAIGAYTVHNSMFDVYLMVVFGVIGYAFKKLSYPLAPMVLALVLGDGPRKIFRNAIKGSQGRSSGLFLERSGGRLDQSGCLLFWRSSERGALGAGKKLKARPVRQLVAGAGKVSGVEIEIGGHSFLGMRPSRSW